MFALNKIILGYVAATFLQAFAMLLSLALAQPENYEINLYWFFASFLAVAVVVVPLIILAIVAYKKQIPALRAFSEAFIIVVFTFFIPLWVIRLFGSNFYILLFYIMQVSFSSFIVVSYRLPKAFMLPAVFLPGLFNIYLLSYGFLKREKTQTDRIKTYFIILIIVSSVVSVGGLAWRYADIVTGNIASQGEQEISENEELDTSTWQTYRNRALSFEIKLPEYFYTFDENKDFAFISNVKIPAEWKAVPAISWNQYFGADNGILIVFSVIDSSEAESIEDWVREQRAAPYYFRGFELSPIGGEQGIYQKQKLFNTCLDLNRLPWTCPNYDISRDFVSYSAYILKDRVVYHIEFQGQIQKEELFNRILSTLRFIGEEEHIANSEWKTYQNEKYIYSFDHPVYLEVEDLNEFVSYPDTSPAILIPLNQLWLGFAESRGNALKILVMSKGSDTAKQIASRIWQINKEDDNPNFPTKIVGDLEDLTFLGKKSYKFSVTSSFEVGSLQNIGTGFLIDRENTVLFVDGETVVYTIIYPSKSLLAEKILSTFRFVE